jgi:hypothetical protein
VVGGIALEVGDADLWSFVAGAEEAGAGGCALHVTHSYTN